MIMNQKYIIFFVFLFYRRTIFASINSNNMKILKSWIKISKESREQLLKWYQKLMQKYVLRCKRATCSARLPTLLGRCFVRASCVDIRARRVSASLSSGNYGASRAWTRARTCARGERAPLLTRRAKRRACVRVSACEYFHTEVNNTPRYPGQGWPTTTSSLRSPVSPKIPTLSSRVTRATRVSSDERVFRLSYALYVYISARSRVTHAYAPYSTCKATLPATGHRSLQSPRLNMPRRDPWYWAR